ncbi:hypothetical protein [Paracoccus pacificus]|uniref:Uncharacterized protein n=1 Tax=Paracoccus pacificus TaxID=1463598 RepID=A0ABW4RBF9_9RHOB
MMKPVWSRMQSHADTAEAEKVEKDRAEIETAWSNLGEIARVLLPDLKPITAPREAVAKVIALWRIRKETDEKRVKDRGQRE